MSKWGFASLSFQGLFLGVSCLGRGVLRKRAFLGGGCSRVEGSGGERSLLWTRTWEEGRANDLVGGNDPLARVLEQLLVPPERVLAGQPLRQQIVVAEPEQAQRLQEGLAVPSLRPEGCIRRGNTGDEVSGGGTQGSGTSRTPRPPSNQPWRLWSPPPPLARPQRPCPTRLPHRTAPGARAVPWRGRARST